MKALTFSAAQNGPCAPMERVSITVTLCGAFLRFFAFLLLKVKRKELNIEKELKLKIRCHNSPLLIK